MARAHAYNGAFLEGEMRLPVFASFSLSVLAGANSRFPRRFVNNLTAAL
jgi:hypothetical protein